MGLSQHSYIPPSPLSIQTRHVCFRPDSGVSKPENIYEHYTEVEGELDTIAGYSLSKNYDPLDLIDLSTYLGGGTVTQNQCPCVVLDYSLPVVEYGPYNTTRRVPGAIGSSVQVDNVEVTVLAPNVGDTAIVPFSFIGRYGCEIPADAAFTRLTGGNQSTTINTVSSNIFNLGADSWRITLRALPDDFGNLPQFDWVIMPSQMAGNERFVIELGIDTQPDDYIRGGGAPAVTLPLTSTLFWGNGNSTNHSTFRYNGVSEVTFRLNGLNARSNVTSFGILNGPDLIEYEACDILDLIKRVDLSEPLELPQTIGFQ